MPFQGGLNDGVRNYWDMLKFAMKLYVFKNFRRNECEGEYYFLAHNKEEAQSLADHMAKEHNKEFLPKTSGRFDNYGIEWEKKVKIIELTRPRYVKELREGFDND